MGPDSVSDIVERPTGTLVSAPKASYQGFSLLTANRDAMTRPEMTRIAKRHGRSTAQIVFRFALDIGVIPLTGTTDAAHMRADLEVFDFRLERAKVELIERLMTSQWC